ncbi:MAG: hypothetical protein M1320_01770 [Patescibacteria group bacterium]|nr:hypothetical protein [Patescibacteria group bacterium]
MYLIRNIKERVKKNKTSIILGILAFLALAIAFATGYLVARDYEQAPIIIQQRAAE